MFDQLPSLLGFQPKFYVGGPISVHLPFLYDLVARKRPKLIVSLGFGEGEAHFTFCQVMQEHALACRCVSVREQDGAEADDVAWRRGKTYSEKHYARSSEMRAEPPAAVSELFANGSVDLLLIDDCDSGAELREKLSAWNPKLAGDALVLFHGTKLERADDPRAVWLEWTSGRETEELSEGLGLGIASSFEKLFGAIRATAVPQLYQLAARRMIAEVRATDGSSDRAASQVQKAWLRSNLTTAAEAQRVMDDQSRNLRELTQRFETLRRDRAKAQLIMDAQAEQLQNATATTEKLLIERDKLKARVAEQKLILNAGKAACRRGGKCLRLPNEKKERRPLQERISRELHRWPRKLRGLFVVTPPAQASKEQVPTDRYERWIAEHEPDAAGLKLQRHAWAVSSEAPKLSLLLPTFNPPAGFLQELIGSIEAQTYGNFEICIVDGGSNSAAKKLLQTWQERESRVRVEFLPENLGIAENTNRALALATGQFFTCIDQDDLLAPFALHALARAITRNPEAEIFYSDEDRLNDAGKRHAPFFKPEWSPEYLLSSMYLGHLTAYRRDLVVRVGGFRKEFDLSQDYDFALRASETTRAVIHIPQVLYHWREHPASGSAGGKPGARATNLAALRDAMQRRGLAAEIIEYPTANRARLLISDWPKVSIIVPTDSVERARRCAEQLRQATSYPDFEVVIVTNSRLVDSLAAALPQQADLRLIRYDKAFNFSDKCNVGAQAASGTRLIFFNDDVESGQLDWIQNLIEPLENPEVGAVAPKLLYETGKIQHAGLVTGVRGLVGTACHQWPNDSTDYANFAQSMRDVSALSAACLAMRRDDFFALGEFDTVNTPIAHSDIDLCFKVRAAGLRCVYTPFATMMHRGHVSIGAVEDQTKTSEDRASLYLLKRWPEFTCHDPYFPRNMRDWLYADSPTPIRMWAKDQPSERQNGHAVLFVSHDLSWSGAPLIVWQIAKWCRERGYFAVVMSPEDGPLRQSFVDAGIPLIVDPLVKEGHSSFTQLAREFDCVIASTIFGAPVIRAAKSADIPHLWWIHEGRVAEHYLNKDATMRLALATAYLIVSPDVRSAQLYQSYSDRPVRILSYGIPDPSERLPSVKMQTPQPITFLLMGTVEYRKGQSIFLQALRKLPEDLRRSARFQIVGRPHDPLVTKEVRSAAEEIPTLHYQESVPPDEALALIRDADVMVCASWDETGPLILMEALAFGKPILSTRVGSVAEHLIDEDAGIFFEPGDFVALANGIARFMREPELLPRCAQNARQSYEKYFTFERFGESFEALLREAMQARDVQPLRI